MSSDNSNDIILDFISRLNTELTGVQIDKDTSNKRVIHIKYRGNLIDTAQVFLTHDGWIQLIFDEGMEKYFISPHTPNIDEIIEVLIKKKGYETNILRIKDDSSNNINESSNSTSSNGGSSTSDDVKSTENTDTSDEGDFFGLELDDVGDDFISDDEDDFDSDDDENDFAELDAESNNELSTSIEDSIESDEVDESITYANERKLNFSRMNIGNVTSDLSFIVLSKLMYNGTLQGYRFRLNNGCLDISVDKGRELGIVPYKISKRVNLKEINGVFASNYECTHRVLFPDISNDDKLCRTLLQTLLSQG